MSQPPFKAELVRIERNPWLLALGAFPFLGTVVFSALALYDPSFIVAVPQTMVVGVLASIFLWRLNLRPVARALDVVADAEGLRLGGSLIARATIQSGFVNPSHGAPRVLLYRSAQPAVELQAATTEEARDLLRALGLDASQTVADFRIPSRLLEKRRYAAVFGVCMTVLAVGLANMVRLFRAFPEATALGVTMFVGCLVGFAALMVVRSRLRVGRDGIELRWLHTRRFLQYDSVVGVSRYQVGWGNSQITGLRIELRSGDTMDVPVHRGRWLTDHVALIEERIREAREAVSAGDSAVDAAFLERGDRRVKDWVSALHAIGSGANATHRTAPVQRASLMRIVEDATLPAATRAAAAVALGTSLDDEGRARLRVVAESTAASKLRVSIEKAALGEDSAIEEALDDLETETRASQAARRP